MALLTKPLTQVKKLDAAQVLRIAELGLRGSFRLAQTVTAVYPRALKWLVQWRQPEPHEVRELFEALGTTYIKFGQFIASSPSVFPKNYVDEFQLCLDRTPAIPFTKVKQIVEQDLGRPLGQVFASIEPQSLASASIAQVHAAKLLSGEDVVVKVQKPGVEAVLTTDMNAVYLLTRLMELIMPNTDREAVAGLVAEMYQSMVDECDFIKEAENLTEFRRFLQNTDNTQVVAPKPYPQASGRKVLTMERLYGRALTDNSVDSMGIDPAASLFNALNTWFASLTQCPFFHADLHSGNLLLLDDGRVGFIDFGMVGRIQPEAWQAMFTLFTAISTQDYRSMAEAMVTVGITREKVDVDGLTRDIAKLFQGLENFDAMAGMGVGGEAGDGINALLSELGNIARNYGIRFPRAFTMLLKQFLYFDRYVDMLAPGADIFHDQRIDMMRLH
ncbi:AarF/ABC1/UbiB kinase family protein [Spongiibacter sp. KMU-158]|uniref:AarF/ABC1/UbiB kinase family protein n=1 Tax=Spongiibacter pelagi TaxID=2760804 RepID=A0A927C0G6_9GAMM|nr:AarF/UbiB family protein [Spongiibacter pelagi]MBD2858989.1 AarF/ABC1/UbiB kinase family protein [Spongiibacter pelagi]